MLMLGNVVCLSASWEQDYWILLSSVHHYCSGMTNDKSVGSCFQRVWNFLFVFALNEGFISVFVLQIILVSVL